MTDQSAPPAVVFIELDEVETLDRLARRREPRPVEDDQARQDAIVKCLAEVDAVIAGYRSDFILIPTTNRADLIDPALVATRFKRPIQVGLPDKAGIEATFAIYCRDLRLAPNVNLRQVAERCAGFSGFEIQVVCGVADEIARRRYQETVLAMRVGCAGEEEVSAFPRQKSQQDFLDAIAHFLKGAD